MASVSADIVSKWHDAVEAFDADRLSEAREGFYQVQNHSAKILFNMSTVDLLLGDTSAAHTRLNECLKRDSYLAVGHFQRGITACYLGRLEEAVDHFTKALENIRNGDFIDYKQLGMVVRLTKEQIRHNVDTVKQKMRAQPSNCQVSNSDLMTLPLKQCVFRPAKSLVDNLQKRHFLKEAKVVSAVPEIKTPASYSSTNNALIVGKSSSAPTSPAAGRKLHMDAVTRGRLGVSTPPPTRPPPRLPPGVTGATLGACIGGSVNKPNHNGTNQHRKWTEARTEQEGLKGDKNGRVSVGGVVPHETVAGTAKGLPVSCSQRQQAGRSEGQRLLPPSRQPPPLPGDGDKRSTKPSRPPPPKKS